MSVVVIGVNHRTVPLEVLERMSVSDANLPKALHDLATRPNLAEVVVLSTCNRTEVYAVAERFHGAFQDVRDFLCTVSDLPPEDISDHLYSHYDDGAVEHLFSVAAGLDSAVLGESEILGQVRVAWERAQEERTARSLLNLLFRSALEVGKRARTETSIGRHTTSVSQAAVAMAADQLGSLEGRSVLVLGAGEMGEGMAVALAGAGVAEMLVTNRTESRAVELAERVGGRAVPISEAARHMARVDLVLSGTAAESVLLEAVDVEMVMASRGGRPLLMVDVAVPRDIDAAVGRIDGVSLLDLDDLRRFAARGLSERQGEVAAVRQIVGDEVQRYQDEALARTAAPLIAALWQRAESVRTAEMERHRSRLDGLDESTRNVVEMITRGIVAKLLHDPSVRLKDVAGSPRAERLSESLRELFDL